MEPNQLTADEVRALDEGDYIVAELHDDEYWEQGEGRVASVKEWDKGTVTVYLHAHNHTAELHVPADARAGLTLDARANQATDLRVTKVRKPPYNEDG